MRCLNCNLTVSGDAKVCPICKAKISREYHRCDSCFTKLGVSEKICPKCGCDLTVNRDDDFVHYDERNPKFQIPPIKHFFIFAAAIILIAVLLCITMR